MTRQAETRAQSSDPIGAAAAVFSERYVRVSDGTELRILAWKPEPAVAKAPLVFLAGWVSVLAGWADLLRVLTQQRPVFYIESREKRSARIPRERLGKTCFTIPRLADDLLAVVDQLDLDLSETVFFGSSMGSNAILEALKHGRLKARGAFLVGPNGEFRFPWWGKILIRFPAIGYHPVKYVVLWYLRHFRVAAKQEPEQMQRYERTLREAHPVRIKLSAQAVQGSKIWHGLETIEVPVAIAWAPSDTLHGADDGKRIADLLPAGRSIRCLSNRHTHGPAIIKELNEFWQDIS